ncbi:MAG TPA: hypothetical protein VGL91_14530 [Acidobacteriota bacterium]|jgi:hypothetical protein
METVQGLRAPAKIRGYNLAKNSTLFEKNSITADFAHHDGDRQWVFQL